MRHAERRIGRGGFTLIELVIGLLIGSILITVIFQLMVGQTRISGIQSAREEAQQNARGGLEILSSELRSLMPAALLEATSQSLTFMQPRGWGILCGPHAGATANIDVAFPATTPAELWQVNNATTNPNGLLVQQAVNDWRPARQGTLAGSLSARARITGATLLGAPSGAVCSQLQAQGNIVVVRFATSAGVDGQVGSVVALYTLTRYDVASQGGELWIRRNAGMQSANVFNPQPLAGPIAPETDRFRFWYLNGAGADLGTPGTATVALDAVRQVRIRVVTRSTQKLDGRAQRDSGEAVVLLRNDN